MWKLNELKMLPLSKTLFGVTQKGTQVSVVGEKGFTKNMKQGYHFLVLFPGCS